jgi:hypothetical protein
MNKVLLGILIIFFMIISVNAGSKVAVTLENCEPGTYVGMVQWLNNKTDYKDLPEAEIKRAGKLTIMLEPGEYAITHYRPTYVIKMDNGEVLIIPSKIIEFRNVVVTKVVTFSFGCKWKMKGAV